MQRGVPSLISNAILLFFSVRNLEEINANDLIYYDKLEPKKNYKELGIRVVPPGVVRYGAFCEPGVVVMPGFGKLNYREFIQAFQATDGIIQNSQPLFMFV